MVTYTTVPHLTDQDVGKVLLANYLQDGDPAGWFRPPFVLDKAFQIASNDGLTAIVAYRAGEPYSYTVKGIPLVTKTLKYSAIPSIESGLIATKDGTNGVAITAGVVRYLNSAKEWKEVNVGAQTILLGVPSTGVETVYIVAYDLETTPKIDAYKPAKSLFDAAPNAATVDPQEPAIIIARVDLDGAGNVIAIFNDGIHAGLGSTKAEDLREMMGVIQHNIEPTIDSKTKTTLSYSDLPDRYIIGYTNFGKAKQDNRFPYIGAMVDTKPTVVNTEFMDSAGNAIIQASGNIASQELSRYTSTSNPSGEPLKRSEFVLHPIFVYLDIENTPIINYAIVRSAVVFRKRPLATDPFAQQIKKYMLEETLGNTEVPQFITDFCTLCGFLVVDDAMDLRTSIAEALIIPATEGFSSIQDRPSSIPSPTAADEGFLAIKEGSTINPVGIPVATDKSIFQKTSNGLKVLTPTATTENLGYLTIYIANFNAFNGGTDNFYAINEEEELTLSDSRLADFKTNLISWQIDIRLPSVSFTPSGTTFTVTQEDVFVTCTDDLRVDARLIPTLLSASQRSRNGQDVTANIIHADSCVTITSNQKPVLDNNVGIASYTLQNSIFSYAPEFLSSNNLLYHSPNRVNFSGVFGFFQMSYTLSNRNNRIFRTDLDGAVVVNGRFTNFGTPKIILSPKRFDTTVEKEDAFAYSRLSASDKLKWEEKVNRVKASRESFYASDIQNSILAALLYSQTSPSVVGTEGTAYPLKYNNITTGPSRISATSNTFAKVDILNTGGVIPTNPVTGSLGVIKTIEIVYRKS